MASVPVNHEEEYAKWQALAKHILQIITNLTNIKNVWGTSSRQYAEADAIAAEYLRAFMGPVKPSTDVEEARQVLEALLGNYVPGEAKTLNLVFRPKVPH